MKQHLITCDRCGTETIDPSEQPRGMTLAITNESSISLCEGCVEAFSEFAPNLDRSWKRGLGRFVTHPHVIEFELGPVVLPTHSALLNHTMINLPFWPERFEFIVDNMDAWALNDFRIGNRSQLKSRPAIPRDQMTIPLALFADLGHARELMGDYETCQPNMDISIVVTYLGEIADGERFRCRLHGYRGGFAKDADTEESGTPCAREVDQAITRMHATFDLKKHGAAEV
jgi:hypothetical protein